MARNTYSDRVNIIKYVKVNDAWRFAPVAKGKNGNIRWDHVIVSGADQHYPEGKYFIEWRENGTRRRKSVGTIPSEILAEAQRKRAALHAQAVGVEIVPDRMIQRQNPAQADCFVVQCDPAQPGVGTFSRIQQQHLASGSRN